MINQNIKIAVDAIVFGYEKNVLYVLAVQQRYGVFKDRWVLPGGFIKDDESLIDAVKRELQEEAGISVNYLEPAKYFWRRGKPRFAWPYHICSLFCIGKSSKFYT